MPSHQDRREPLPKGYQFGEARAPHEHKRSYVDSACEGWRCECGAWMPRFPRNIFDRECGHPECGWLRCEHTMK